MHVLCALPLLALTNGGAHLSSRVERAAGRVARDGASRREATQLFALALGVGPGLLASRADASSNPANSYYFPMAKYRYVLAYACCALVMLRSCAPITRAWRVRKLRCALLFVLAFNPTTCFPCPPLGTCHG